MQNDFPTQILADVRYSSDLTMRLDAHAPAIWMSHVAGSPES